MYVTVTRTKGSPGQPLEVATIAGEEMLPWLREIDGFDGLLMLSNEAEANKKGPWSGGPFVPQTLRRSGA